MDKSYRNWLILVPALAVSTALAAQGDADSSALQIDSDSVSLEKDLIHFGRPRIVQGNLKIEADDGFATDMEVKNHGELRFTGSVQITVERGLVEADSAVFTFNDNKLARAEISGMPASFTAQRADATKEQVRGSANEIQFDNVAQTLRMSGLAQITQDRYIFQGCDLIYDFKREAVANGPSECDERFKIRVLPNSQEEAATAPPAPPP